MVKCIKISLDEAGQRIDNFLIRSLKGVPKTRIYRALRKGEVRVNKGRVKAEYRLRADDEVRIPPISVRPQTVLLPPKERLAQKINDAILYEDDEVLIFDKPAGMPVHGGSGVQGGVIEWLRLLRPNQKFLELVHRLDRDTSGCLLVAKKRSVLVTLHKLWRERKVQKRYWLWVKGRWPYTKHDVNVPLRKNILQSGERVVKVDPVEGKPAKTRFRLIKQFSNIAWLEAEPVTGRTHQIRVHAAAMGFPILGDPRYGDAKANDALRKRGIKRMMLHSAEIAAEYGEPLRRVGLCALCTPFTQGEIDRLFDSA